MYVITIYITYTYLVNFLFYLLHCVWGFNTMSSVSEVVEAAFSDVSFGLDGDHRLDFDLQVNGLLRHYLEAREDAAAIPAQVATHW